jgi:hypothetical protein
VTVNRLESSRKAFDITRKSENAKWLKELDEAKLHLAQQKMLADSVNNKVSFLLLPLKIFKLIISPSLTIYKI